MGASCKIIGDTLAETAYLSGRWGFSWGTRFLRDLETVSNAVKGMQYIDDEKVRGYIANGVRDLVSSIFNKEDGDSKSVFEQYMETAKEYESERLKVDDPIYMRIKNNDYSRNKVTISLHEGKFIDGDFDTNEDVQRSVVDSFYSYSDLFWNTISSKIDSCFTVDDFTDDVVIPKSVYKYLTLFIDRLGGHMDIYSVKSIEDMINELKPYVSDIKHHEKETYDEKNMSVALKFLEDMIRYISKFKHSISIKFVYGGIERYRNVSFRYDIKEGKDTVIADEGINLRTTSVNVADGCKA